MKVTRDFGSAVRVASHALDSDDPIVRVWQGTADVTFLTSQASHALTLIAATMKEMGRSDPVFWFPAYYCEGCLPALRKTGADIVFYPVTASMAPDWDACERLALGRPPDLFTLTHLFGIENELETARAFANRHNALLHEDNAHALRPFGTVGTQGDFVSHSPRKFISLPDGGILAVRGAQLAGAARMVTAALPAARHSAALWQWLRIRESLRPPRRPRPLRPVTLDDDVNNAPPFEEIWPSRAGERHLRHLVRAGRIDAIAARQREQYARRAARVSGQLEAVRAHPAATPRFLLFRGHSEEATVAAINDLRAQGVNAFTWPGMPPEVVATPSAYGAAMTLRRSLVRIPAL